MKKKTMIVTGAAKGIGAGVTKALMDRGYNVVANSIDFTNSALAPAETLALVEGNIGKAATAAKTAEVAIRKFGSIDGVVNNAGIFFTKSFTEYTENDFQRLSETNLEGYIYVTQLAVKQMLAQKTGGSITCITSAMVEHPIAGVNASIPMITKGGLAALTRSLAMEYVKEGIRFNAVAPGVVDTPMHVNDSKEFLKGLSPMGTISDVDDIVDAIVYLTEARHVTGGGAARRRRCAQRQMVNNMVKNTEERLATLAIELPLAVTPFGPYVPAVRTGNLLFLSGMLPTLGHEPKFLGRIGNELTVEQGSRAAYVAALNVLAVARQNLGSLDKVSRVVKLGVYIATAGNRPELVKIADAASGLLREVFGEDKLSARLVFGVESLPFGVPIELEVIFEIA